MYNTQSMRTVVKEAITDVMFVRSSTPRNFRRMYRSGLDNPGAYKLVMAEEMEQIKTNNIKGFIGFLNMKFFPKKFEANLDKAVLESKEIEKMIDEKFDKLYPKTKKVRHEILNKIAGGNLFP